MSYDARPPGVHLTLDARSLCAGTLPRARQRAAAIHVRTDQVPAAPVDLRDNERMRDAFHEDLDRISDQAVEMTKAVGTAMNRATRSCSPPT